MENIEKIVDEVEIEMKSAVQDYLDPIISENLIDYADEVMSDIKLEDYYSDRAIGERFLGEI